MATRHRGFKADVGCVTPPGTEKSAQKAHFFLLVETTKTKSQSRDDVCLRTQSPPFGFLRQQHTGLRKNLSAVRDSREGARGRVAKMFSSALSFVRGIGNARRDPEPLLKKHTHTPPCIYIYLSSLARVLRATKHPDRIGLTHNPTAVGGAEKLFLAGLLPTPTTGVLAPSFLLCFRVSLSLSPLFFSAQICGAGPARG